MAAKNFNTAFNPDGSVADSLTITVSDSADTLTAGYGNDNLKARSFKGNPTLLGGSGNETHLPTGKTINPDDFLGKKTHGFQQPCRKSSADSKSSMGGAQ